MTSLHNGGHSPKPGKLTDSQVIQGTEFIDMEGAQSRTAAHLHQKDDGWMPVPSIIYFCALLSE